MNITNWVYNYFYNRHPLKCSAPACPPAKGITGGNYFPWMANFTGGVRVTRCGVRVAGCGFRVAGYGFRVAGCGVRVARCELRGAGYGVRGAGVRVAGFVLRGAGFVLQGAGRGFFDFGFGLPAIVRRLRRGGRGLRIANRSAFHRVTRNA
jgi:hypothetical protein